MPLLRTFLVLLWNCLKDSFLRVWEDSQGTFLLNNPSFLSFFQILYSYTSNVILKYSRIRVYNLNRQTPGTPRWSTVVSQVPEFENHLRIRMILHFKLAHICKKGHFTYSLPSFDISFPSFSLRISLPTLMSAQLSSQGLPLEFVCGSAAPGSHLDVGCSGHDRQALHPVPDLIRRLRFPPRLRHSHGALYPSQRGRPASPHPPGSLYLAIGPSLLCPCPHFSTLIPSNPSQPLDFSCPPLLVLSLPYLFYFGVIRNLAEPRAKPPKLILANLLTLPV